MLQVFADNPVATLSKQTDLKLFTALLEMAGATAVFSEPKARVTLLAPTDAVRVYATGSTALKGLRTQFRLCRKLSMIDQDCTDSISCEISNNCCISCR
jgi:hypothetical protein